MKDWFLRLTLIILTVTSAAKLVSAFGHAPVLLLPDPVLDLPNRWMFLIAGGVEIGVVAYVLSKARPISKIAAILGLSVSFSLYRICRWLVNAEGTCPCMGSLYGPVGLSEASVDVFMKLALVLLLGGSVYFLVTEFLAARSSGLRRLARS